MQAKNLIGNTWSGPPRGGGRGGQSPRGPWASGGLRWLQGAQHRVHRNDTEKSACEARRPFFLRSLVFGRKNPLNFVEDLFFWRSHHILDQTAAFSPPFWAAQDRKSVIFELAPGPRSAPGGPAHGDRERSSD